jgi:hypothetical protein
MTCRATPESPCLCSCHRIEDEDSNPLKGCDKCPVATKHTQPVGDINEQLSRLIIENQSLDGAIDISDQSCMKDEILVLIAQSNLALLDRLEEELPISERMAWSDEDGLVMETVVFRTNMKAWLQSERALIEKRMM